MALLLPWLPLTPVALLASPSAVTTTVLPKTATLQPNQSIDPVLEALRYACWLQLVPSRTKTYAAPESVALLFVWFPSTPVALLFSKGAPITIVSPAIATDQPKFWL